MEPNQTPRAASETDRNGYEIIVDGNWARLSSEQFEKIIEHIEAIADLLGNKPKALITDFEIIYTPQHIFLSIPEDVAMTSLSINAENGEVRVGTPKEDGE